MRALNLQHGFALSLLLVGAGCGKGTYPLQGRVTLDGKPVERAMVHFIPEAESSPRLAFAMTDIEGRFVVATFQNNDGILPGIYRVTITNAENTIAPLGPPSGDQETNALAMAAYRQQVESLKKKPAVPGKLPVVFAELDTTPLRWKVPEDGRIADFDLKWEAAAAPRP